MKSTGLIATLLAVTPLAHADLVELLNGDTLTGSVTAMSADSTTMESPISVTPLEINSSAIKRVTFPNTQENESSHTEIITLANGDRIPCRVTSMGTENVKISTWYAGDFTIARENIRSLRFGVSKQREIYAGGDALSKWDKSKGSWILKDGSYTARSTGYISKKLDLPENIRIRFDLAWQDTPNFVLRFCAANHAATTKQDTYQLTFNSAGMQIGRYDGSRIFAPLGTISHKPRSIDPKKISVDLRINRNKGSITLYLDSKKVGTYYDTFDTAEGNHIIFNNRSSSSSACTLSNIHVSDWNDGEPNRHFSKVSHTKTDVVIDSEGDRISGSISSITSNSNNHRSVQFKAEHSTKPLIIPDRRVSVLYFAEPKEASEFPDTVFTVNLDNYGRLQLGQPKLENNQIITRHPILGQCTIDTKIISSITQSKTTTEK